MTSSLIFSLDQWDVCGESVSKRDQGLAVYQYGESGSAEIRTAAV